eukprot:2061254-Prymnesium_polylepis.2
MGTTCVGRAALTPLPSHVLLQACARSATGSTSWRCSHSSTTRPTRGHVPSASSSREARRRRARPTRNAARTRAGCGQLPTQPPPPSLAAPRAPPPYEAAWQEAAHTVRQRRRRLTP